MIDAPGGVIWVKVWRDAEGHIFLGIEAPRSCIILREELVAGCDKPVGGRAGQDNTAP